MKYACIYRVCYIWTNKAPFCCIYELQIRKDDEHDDNDDDNGGGGDDRKDHDRDNDDVDDKDNEINDDDRGINPFVFQSCWREHEAGQRSTL